LLLLLLLNLNLVVRMTKNQVVDTANVLKVEVDGFVVVRMIVEDVFMINKLGLLSLSCLWYLVEHMVTLMSVERKYGMTLSESQVAFVTFHCFWDRDV
jgi:hypothetical protein